MTKRKVLIVVWTFVALCGCTEREQVIGQGVRADQHASQGTGTPVFTAGGWKPGDRASWELGLKTRTQNGQNDYTKVN